MRGRDMNNSIPFLAWVVLGWALMAPPAQAEAGKTNPGDRADLELYIYTATDELHVGETVELTITVANFGPTSATGVQVHYRVPDGWTFLQADAADATDTYDPISGIWHVGEINSEQLSTTPSWELTIHARAEVPGVVGHIAEVLAAHQNDPDSTPANGAEDEDDYAATSQTVVAWGPIDLKVQIDADKAEALPGENIRYMLTYTNLGEEAAGVVLTETLPPYAQFDFITSSPGWQAQAGGTYKRALGTLAPGATGTVIFAITLDAAWPEGNASISNTASIADNGQRGPDGNPADNTTSLTLAIQQVQQADLALAMTVDDDALVVGEAVRYTLQLQNDGPAAATNVQVGLHLPDAVAYTSHTGSGTFDSVTGTWQVGSLSPHTTAVLEVDAQTLVPGTWAASAEVMQVDQADPDSEVANGGNEEDDAAEVAFAATLAVPSLVSPANGAEDVALPLTFQWLPVVAATNYRWQLVLNGHGFEEPLLEVVTTDTAVLVEELEAGQTYQWRVQAVAGGEAGPWSGERMLIVAGVAVHTEENSPLPATPTLLIFPNPIRTTGTLRFSVPNQQAVRVTAFDLLGRHVKEVYNGTALPNHTLSLAIDLVGLPQGVYFVRLQGDAFVETRQVVLVE